VYLRSASQARDSTPDSGDHEASTKKRLHSTRDSFTEQSRDDPSQSNIVDGGQGYDSPEPNNHAHKRSRPSDPAEWPLRNHPPNLIGVDNSIATLPRRTSAASLNSGRNTEDPRQHAPGRPSRFQEGSMNDRASKNPPPAFTEGYDAVGRYLAEQEHMSYPADPNISHDRPQPRDKMNIQKPPISQSSGSTSEPQRSGIWRFGKAIADWFNYNKFVREEDEKARQKRILERRQEKAMRVYQDLKRTGQLGALGKHGTRSSANLTAPSLHQTGWSHPGINNRDSGVDVDENRYFDRQRDQRDAIPSLDVDQMLMPPPSLPVFGRSGTPSTIVSPSSRQSTFSFRRPSIPDLKKARSEAQLPSSNYATQFTAPSSNPDPDETMVKNVLRKQPSKKDLQRQQKLSRRVSDLESKLQVARRELCLALGEAETVPPVSSPAINRKAFVAGALRSLPSESRVLRGASGNNEVDGDPGATAGGVQNKSPAVEVANPRVSKANVVEGPKASKAKSLVKTGPKSVIKVEPIQRSKKRKPTGGADDDGKYKPSSDTDDDPMELTPERTPKKKPGRPKKVHKTKAVGSMESAAMKDKPAMQDNRDRSTSDDPQSNSQPTAEADTLTNPARPSRSVPPVPKLPASIERLVKLTNTDSGGGSTNVDPKKRPQPKQLMEPYEWPEDVF
jgi:hypothetical protein